MENGFSPSSLNRWMLETFNDPDLDDAIVQESDGTLTTVKPNYATLIERNKVFSRQVSTYVERQKNLLQKYFVKTPRISEELRRLEDYSVKLSGEDLILKRDLFGGRFYSLTSTLLTSPALELFQLKDEIFKSAAAPWLREDLQDGLDKYYNYLYELYKRHLITIQGFHGILVELSDDIESRLYQIENHGLSSSQRLNQSLVPSYVENSKYDLALLKLIEPNRGILFTVDDFKLYNFVKQLTSEQIDGIIANDPQMIANLRTRMDDTVDKKLWSTGTVSNTPRIDMQLRSGNMKLRSGKKIATKTPKMSIAEQKRQLCIKLSAEQAEKSVIVRPSADPVVSQCRLADVFRRLHKVCQGLAFETSVTDQILTLDFQSMSAEVLDHTLKKQCGLNDYQARLILECVKTPQEIDALMSQRERTEQNSPQSPATISCTVEHESIEHEVVVILPDDSLADLVHQDSLESTRVFEVTPVQDEPMPAMLAEPPPPGEAPYYPEITQELLTNTLIEEIGKEYPSQIHTYASIIQEHIGNVSLTRKQAYKVIRGDKRTIDHVFSCCQIQAAQRQIEMEEAAGDFSVIDVDAMEVSSTPLVRGEVSLRVGAGIQASDNNCGLAAFFMSISNNGLLDQLIGDAQSRVADLLSSKDARAASLKRLVDLLQHFNPRGDLGKFIPNSGLDFIRLRYRLRVARVYPQVIDDAYANKEELVILTVASQFRGGADLSASNRNAFVTFEFFWGDDGFSAVVMILPSITLGLMQIRGANLRLGQGLTLDELKELEFVPLGEYLEPIEFIPPILDEIYGFNNSESELLNSGSIWHKSTTSFKQKVSIVEMQGDCQTEGISSLPSKNFSNPVEGEVVPDGFILDPTKTVRNAHPFMEGVVGTLVEHYFKDDVLRLKLIRDLHHSSQDETRRTYEFYDENGMFEKKTICNLEKYFADERVTFVRAKVTEYIGEGGERKRIELGMFGYSAERPDDGEVKIRIMNRARNFQDLLNIFIDSWKDRFGDDAKSARMMLLPDGQHSPEVIFMTIPNEGKDQRCDFDWESGVRLPRSDSEQSIPYYVSSVMSIQDTHYVSWLRQPGAGLIHYADSMGDSDPKLGMVPTVVTLPDKNGAEKLHFACGLCGGADGYILASARDKLLSLGQQVALVILKKNHN